MRSGLGPGGSSRMGVTICRSEECAGGEFEVDGDVAGWTGGVYEKDGMMGGAEAVRARMVGNVDSSAGEWDILGRWCRRTWSFGHHYLAISSWAEEAKEKLCAYHSLIYTIVPHSPTLPVQPSPQELDPGLFPIRSFMQKSKPYLPVPSAHLRPLSMVSKNEKVRTYVHLREAEA